LGRNSISGTGVTAIASPGWASLDLQEFPVHPLDLPSGYVGPVSTKTPSERTGDMHQFVDEYLHPVFCVERIKSFGDELDDVLGLLIED